MPYIEENRRETVNPTCKGLPVNPGELNFQVSKLINSYLYHHGLSYSTINEVVGVLECTKLELYRRIAIPYENTKIKDNGDVYYRRLTKTLE